jgi:hypothetical protein
VDWLFNLLMAFWWYGLDGRGKTADAADTYLRPVLMVVCAVCLVGLLMYVGRH